MQKMINLFYDRELQDVIFDSNSSHASMSFFLMIHFVAILVLQSCGKLKWAEIIHSIIICSGHCFLQTF